MCFGVHDIRQTNTDTDDLLVRKPRLVEVEIAIGKLKSYKSPGTDQIPAEMMKQEVKNYVLRYTDLFVLYGIRKNCHSSGRNLLPNHFIKRVISLTVIIIDESSRY
jgi:hypothetical protein